MNAAVILAGGTGTRLKSDIPKQYIELDSQPIIAWSTNILTDNSNVDKIWIVANEEWHSYILEKVNLKKFVEFIKPGESRQLSIWNSLQVINQYIKENDEGDDNNSTVLVHDAARPLLSSKMIDLIYSNMRQYDGVMPVLPMKDTVYVSNDGKSINSLLDRSKLFAGQAPECFYFNDYYEANKSLLPDEIYNINGSSEPAVMYGMNIGMIPGDENNFKITTKEDLERFKSIILKC